MAILAKPSRSYANVEHDPNGLSGVGNAPYSRKDGFKTYRPSLVETHLKRPALYDPHPNSAFSPLPPAFNLSRHARRDQAIAGQRAELDQILQPEYKASQPDLNDPDSASIAGPSRSATTKTSGGSIAEKRRAKHVGLGLRPSASLNNFKSHPSSGRVGGIYVDANGKVHDTEFDPFGGVAEMSRRKSRRRSAFGSDRRKGSGSETSSSSGSEVQYSAPRKSMDSGADEEEIRRRLEVERRRMDEVSGLAAARRRSMMSDRNSGRATPSIRSSEDGLTSAASTQYDRTNGGSRSQQGHYVPSPLSPTFAQHPNGHPAYATRNFSTATGVGGAPDEPMPRKSTERTTAPVKEKKETPVSISVKDKKITVTGFDAPQSARPLSPRPETPNKLASQFENLRVPDSARLSDSSRRSSDSTRPKPREPPREDLYPETPAQVKRREERERRAGRAPGTSGVKSRAGSLGIDTALSQSNGRGRVLPEIEIVEDDDPRIVFPSSGKTTRVQTVHDHVIRGPFSMALHAQTAAPADGLGRRASSDYHSARSFNMGGGGSIDPSTIIDQGTGGYLPSRWASGDRELRVTEDAKEKYRPREWGGKTGDLGGRSEEWRPTIKEEIKRNFKDLSTSARFGMFRAKKKLLRKAEI